MQFFRSLAIVISVVLFSNAIGAQQLDLDNKALKETTLTFGGYAKLDWVITDFRNGEPALNSAIRDIHVPALIPIGKRLDMYDSQLHAKESRFSFEVVSTGFGSPVRMYFEMDFLLSKGGDQRVSNSYNPRIRHFFFQYKNFTFGQTWTTFMTAEAIPDAIIFPGAADGLVFNRQALAKYSYRNWDFSIENPETTVRPNQGTGFMTSSGGVPDVIIKHTFRGEWGLVGIAGIHRALRYADPDGVRHYNSGYGINASGKLLFGERDDLRFAFTFGKGLGRYLALGMTTAAVLDEINKLHPIGTTNAQVTYLHHWNSKWRTSVSYAFFKAQDNSSLTGGNANLFSSSAYVNLLFSPDPRLVFGTQLMYGNRQLESHENGDMFRLQFSAKYSFNFSHTVRHKRK